MRSIWTSAVFVLVLTQGFLSMGFQLVASRLLAPYFGTTLIVWAFLISIFLAAFSLGSFLGGVISQRNARMQRNALALLGLFGVGWFAVIAFAGRQILRIIEPTFEEPWIGTGIACAILFLCPVTALSSLLPVYAELLGRSGRGPGKSSGLIYGTSALGNILGVIVTAFALIPQIGTANLLVGWCLCSLACFLGSYWLAFGAISAT